MIIMINLKLHVKVNIFINLGKSYVIPIKAIRAFFHVKYNTLIEGGIVALNQKHRFSTFITNFGPKSRVKIIK